ncbi:MAG: metallophosphoesterase [Pseudomonadota bacterium]
MIWFLISFLLVYGGMHAYLYEKARSALNLGQGAGIGLVGFMLIMVCSPILIHWLKGWTFSQGVRVFAWVAYCWMGWLFIFCSAVFVFDGCRFFARFIRPFWKFDLARPACSEKTLFLIILFFTVTIAVYALFEAQRIRIERIKISSPKLLQDKDRLVIVQVSDMHLGLISGRRFLERVISHIEKERPDILVSTGDMVDAEPNRLTSLSSLLKEVHPRYGKFAVTGNHEFYAGIRDASFFIKEAGFTLLRDKAITIEDFIAIVGLDDCALAQTQNELPQTGRDILQQVPKRFFTILLKHRPEIEPGTECFFDIQLSGHTHGGQIFPFSLITRFVYPLHKGLHKLVAGSFLYASRGTGTWGPPMRVFAPPEVTVIEICKERID